MTDKISDMKRIITVFSIVAILASCDVEDTLKIDGKGFAVSENAIQFYPGGETVEIMLTAGENWSVNEKPEWIRMNHNSGKAGSCILELSAECNVSHDHNDIISFSSGLNKQTITVSQDQAYLQVRNVKTNSYLSSEGYRNNDSFLWMESENISGYNEPLVLKVEGNVWWRIEPAHGQDYYKISKQEGEGDATVEIIPFSPNISETPYDIKLSIVTPHQNFNRELSITQDNLTFEFNHKEIRINELGEPQDGIDLNELTLKSEVPWSRTNKGETEGTVWEWISSENDGIYDSESPIAVPLGELKIAANETRKEITHAIEFTPDVADVDFSSIKDVFSIKVNQDPFVFNIDDQEELKLNFENADSLDNSKSVTVNASADWKVSSCPDWVQILNDTDSGKGGPGGQASIMKVAPEGQNLTHNKDREGEVVLVNDKVAGLSSKLKVSQDMFKFEPSQENSSLKFLTIPDKENSEYKEFNITVDGAWEIENDIDWLSFVKTSGPSSEEIFVKANSTNSDEADRDGSFKVVSKRHKEERGEDVSFTVNVKQNGFRFDYETPEGFDNDWSPVGEKKTLKIISPTQWNVKSAENCTVTASTYDSDSDVEIAVELNKTGAERLCKVVFFNQDVNKGEGKELPVQFKQKKYDFDVTWPSNLNLSEGKAVVPALPAVKTYTATVNCSGEWIVTSSNPSLASVNKNGNNSFTITLKDNNNMSSREAEISVYNEDLDKTDKITIKQDAYVYEVKVSDLNFEPLETDTKKVAATYECSGEITCDPDKDWINVSVESDKIFVSVDKYTESAQRSGKVVIWNKDKVGDSVVINVTQSGYDFSIDPTDASYTGISSDGTTKTIKLISSGSWKVEVSDANMLSANPASGKTADRVNVVITVTKHTDTEKSREGSVTFVCEDNESRNIKLSFKQDADPKSKE